MQTARENLTHFTLPDVFWEDATADAVFKYNISPHSATGKSPYEIWFGTAPMPTALFKFGKYGTISKHALKSKPSARTQAKVYLEVIEMTHISVLLLENQNRQTIRAVDFLPYNVTLDPCSTVFSPRAAKTTAKYTVSPPKSIQIDTPAPLTPAHALRYPDAKEWAAAPDKEIKQPDDQQVIKWLPGKFIQKTHQSSL